MTKMPEYEQGKFDVLLEIFQAAEEGKDAHEKMEKLLDKSITVLQKLNKIHVKGVAKK